MLSGEIALKNNHYYYYYYYMKHSTKHFISFGVFLKHRNAIRHISMIYKYRCSVDRTLIEPKRCVIRNILYYTINI